MQEENSQHGAQIQQLKSQTDQAENKLTESNKQLEKAENSLKEHEVNIQRLQAVNDEMTAEKVSLEQQCATLSADLEQSKTELMKAAEEKAANESQVKSLMEAKECLMKEFEEKKTEFESCVENMKVRVCFILIQALTVCPNNEFYLVIAAELFSSVNRILLPIMQH